MAQMKSNLKRMEELRQATLVYGPVPGAFTFHLYYNFRDRHNSPHSTAVETREVRQPAQSHTVSTERGQN